jgi:hypothetical protein
MLQSTNRGQGGDPRKHQESMPTNETSRQDSLDQTYPGKQPNRERRVWDQRPDVAPDRLAARPPLFSLSPPRILQTLHSLPGSIRYMQPTSPGADLEINWLPTSGSILAMTPLMRLYWPLPQAMNGTSRRSAATTRVDCNRGPGAAICLLSLKTGTAA